jgi:hypothetical protein
MTDSDPAIRRAEVDNSERPASDYAGRIRSMNDEDAAFEGPPGLCGFRCAQDQASAIAADADARIAELERERDEAVAEWGHLARRSDAFFRHMMRAREDRNEAIDLLRLAWQEVQDADECERIDAFLAAHPAPTPTFAAVMEKTGRENAELFQRLANDAPTTAAEPQNLEQE